MIFQHHRLAIYNQNQHPLVHGASSINYNNPGAPGATNMQSAMDWLFAVLYPQMQPSVATTADLPASGNAINDYRVVLDSGGGKPGGYRWEQREGEATASWHKISEIDWGADSVLQEWQARTQDQFIMRYGYDAIDQTGAAITGVYAGQSLYGGKSASTNLSLFANSGDGAGPVTGFVQVGNNFRPVPDNTFSCGTTTNRWTVVYSLTAVHGTLTLAGGSITDSSHAITFGDNALTTTGAVTGASLKTGTMTITSGFILDTTNAITFGSSALSTSAAITGGSLKTGTATLTGGSWADTSGAVSFHALNLSTSGTLAAGATTATSFIVGTTTITGGSWADSGGSVSFNALNLSTTGTLAAGATTITGALGATQLNAGNTRLAGNTLSTTNSNGDLILAPNGTGAISTAAIYPSANGSQDIGKTAVRYQNLFLSGGISDGTNTMAMATLLSLKDILTGVMTGSGIFYNGTKWVAADPDTEIFHDSISHLTTGGGAASPDAGHTQFALLAGRSGGQTLQGALAASGKLTLDSTVNATKGNVESTSHFAPTTGVTGAVDLGVVTTQLWRNVYLSGQIFGCRVENTTSGTIPAASAANPGRLVFETDTNDLFVDTGGTWKKIDTDNYYNQDAASWTGAVTTHTYDVSGSFTDARKGVWQLQDNSNNHKIIGCDIDFTDATHVRVTVDIPLQAGTYTLVGVG